MFTARQIVDRYMAFFEQRGHRSIENAPLVPRDDPTTLFTSSGMQSLVPYLLGKSHPQGKRLVNVQNCFRAADIDEVGDNRHTTFFRMLGNWSLGDYFKQEEIPWFWEFLTKELGLAKEKLYVTVFNGYESIPKDEESETIWKELLENEGLSPKKRIFSYGAKKNWWSRQGIPKEMAQGEPGGPDTEVFFDFGTAHDPAFGERCHPNCGCGRFMEIGNSVFMQYQRKADGTFRELAQKNVDFGGGLERLLAAVENQPDIFQTTLFAPIITSVEKVTGKPYQNYQKQMRVITDHFIASVFIVDAGVSPSNKERGYILRRLIRRAFDSINTIQGIENMVLPTKRITESVIAQYKESDPQLTTSSEKIVNTILEEINNYRFTLTRARRFIQSKYKIGDELKGATQISEDDAFTLYTTHGLSPSQIRSLGYTFDDWAFAEKMKEHQAISRKSSTKKFTTREKTTKIEGR